MRGFWEKMGNYVITQLVCVAILSALGLWWRSAVGAQLASYVTVNSWRERNDQFMREFAELKDYVQEGRRERLAFQTDVVQRLTAVETECRLVREQLAALRVSVDAMAQGRAMMRGTQ